MDIKLGRQYGYYMGGILTDIFIPEKIVNGVYVGTVTKCKRGESFVAHYTYDIISFNYVPLFVEVKATRLAKKMYPNVVEEDGMLVVPC